MSPVSRRQVLLGGLAGIALTASGCGGSKSSAASDTDITIGAWYPLTGAVAASGIPRL